jgi:NADPH:quinone reductase-like Zn-dependent oxidoreductase
VQLAKLVGAIVIATCGPESVERLVDMGVDEVLDHKKTSVKAWAADQHNRVDLVLDCIGRGALADAWWAAKDGSTVISIFQPPAEVRPPEMSHLEVKHVFFVMEPKGSQLQSVTELILNGSARPSLDSVYPFDRFAEAFAKVNSGKARGKVVLEVLP